MTKSQVTDLRSKAKAATPIYLDDIKDKYGFMKATTCVQTHEDMILGNPSVLYKLDKEAITRLAESYLEALAVIDWYAVDDDVGVAARKFLRKIEGEK